MDSSLPPGCSGIDGHASVLDLPWLERALLWSIRTWAAYHDAPQSVRPALQRAFNEAGISPALEPFARLMGTLFTDRHGCPDIRCVRCLRLGKDEARLLMVLAAVQTKSAYHIDLLLGDLMPLTAVRVAAIAAVDMMHAIASAGLVMQQIPNASETVSWPPSYQAWNTTH